MTRFIAAAILAAYSCAPAHADSWSLHGWTVDLQLTGQGEHVADVLAYNAVTPAVPDGGDTLTEGPLTIGFHIIHTTRSAPDTIRVSVPDGFIAIPAILTLDENTSGIIRIFAVEGMVMG